jgi:putative hemolysin
MELIIIFALAVINGIFSMAEAAVIASRKARLQQAIDKGDTGARVALALADNPNRFLSTVQIGITLIGILSGAIGGATVGQSIADAAERIEFLAPYADAIGFGVIVLITTYLSLIIGELVPKRLALAAPERIASVIAAPMRLLSRLTSPVVTFLGASTDAVLWLLRAHRIEETPVTSDEIEAMIEQGVQAGIIEETAQDMVAGVFKLGDRRVSTLMTPRPDVIWLDVEDEYPLNYRKITNSDYSRYPVCEGDLDHVIGLVQTKDLLSQMLAGEGFDLRKAMHPPQFVPESMNANKVLDLFRESGTHIAFVIDEYGSLEGVVTIQDILEAIVGDVEEADEPIKRADGSWLLDGITTIHDLEDLLEIDTIPGAGDHFETLGGFIMAHQGKIPKAGDAFDWRDLRFEVMDMDGNRVDKVMVTRRADPTTPTPSNPPAANKDNV